MTNVKAVWDRIRPPAEAHWSATSPGLARYLWLLWVIWLIFLWYPLAALFHAAPGAPRIAVVLAAVALFCATYVWNIIRALQKLRTGGPAYSPWPALVLMAAIALGLTIGDRKDWVELFIFVAVSMGPALSPRQALTGVGLMVLLAPVLGVMVGVGFSLIAQMMFQTAVSGVAVVIVGRTIVLDRELREAREEIARLAVSEERLRFARDLHDLLGHSLSLIALKSELAGRLAAASPERASAEMRDVEDVARTALQEVREAVAGYRQARLVNELRNAGEILAAAGIAYALHGDVPALPAAQEAALSWTVREGVTNVIKHGRATSCTVRLTQDRTTVSAEVTDDGHGSSASGHSAGSGLRGLRERISALGGRFEAGPQAEGGFRLFVTLPLAALTSAPGEEGAARSA